MIWTGLKLSTGSRRLNDKTIDAVTKLREVQSMLRPNVNVFLRVAAMGVWLPGDK